MVAGYRVGAISPLIGVAPGVSLGINALLWRQVALIRLIGDIHNAQIVVPGGFGQDAFQLQLSLLLAGSGGQDGRLVHRLAL